MIIQTYEDDYHCIHLYNNNVISYQVKETGDINLNSLQEVLDVFNAMSKGGKFALIVDLRGLKAITKEARTFMTKALRGRLYANAIVTGSGVTKMMGNLILRFNKSEHPQCLFTDDQLAMEWLEKQIG